MTHVAEEPGERDEIVQATSRKRPWRFLGHGERVARDFQAHVVNPGRAAAQEQQPVDDLGGVRGHFTHDLGVAPVALPDRPVVHVVEEPGLASLAVDGRSQS